MKSVEEILGEKVVRKTSLGGGSIHDTARIETASGRSFVLKSSAAGDFFEAEADGLQTLAKPGAIRVPKVFGVSKSFLLIEWFEPDGREDGSFFRDFGRSLARLHRTTADRFGHARDNFIGRLPQDNSREETLSDFFAKRRFLPLVALGRKSGAVSARLAQTMERLCEELPRLLAPIDEPPALLHGDLWNGNYLTTKEGAALIDPAVYFGPREADIAMTSLFGGFPPAFYAGYEEEYPLPRNWRDRVDLFNIYHLLTHAIMFGGGYASRALATADRYLSR